MCVYVCVCVREREEKEIDSELRKIEIESERKRVVLNWERLKYREVEGSKRDWNRERVKCGRERDKRERNNLEILISILSSRFFKEIIVSTSVGSGFSLSLLFYHYLLSLSLSSSPPTFFIFPFWSRSSFLTKKNILKWKDKVWLKNVLLRNVKFLNLLETLHSCH